MHYRYFLHICLLFSLCFLGAATLQGQSNWNPAHSIGSVTSVYQYNASQTPTQLVEVYPAAIPNTGLSYQWYSSLTPDDESFNPISGAQSSSYTFSGPLPQTTYFRRRTRIDATGDFLFSNIVKIQLVSVNWEDRNYLREHTVRINGITTWLSVDALPVGDKLQTTTYMDGLGRTIQKVSRETATPAQANGLWGDVVQFSLFDALGREPEQYLAYTTTNQSGRFKATPKDEQIQYFQALYNETKSFSQIAFENSPLNRVKNVKLPGYSWNTSSGNTAGYEVNTIDDKVQLFAVSYTTGSAPIYGGTYPAGVLYKYSTTDKDNNRVIEFSNKAGQLILKKVQLDNVPVDAYKGWICTYNVYDDFGRLRYQLQPEAVKYLDEHNWSFAGADGTRVLNEFCFQYQFDEKGRNTWKKAPGAEPLFMIYDSRDRVVFVQDGNQRLKSPAEWTTTLYDELDRPVITTLYRTTKSINELQGAVASGNNSPVSVTTPGEAINDLVVDSRDPLVTQYKARNTIEFVQDFASNTGDEFTAEIDPAATGAPSLITAGVYQNPISSSDLNNSAVSTIIKFQFYDNYAFAGVKPFDVNFDNISAYSSSDPNVQPIAVTQRTTGFLTGSKVRILGTAQFLTSTSYYDDRGDQIQSLEDNLKAGKDVVTFQYHFDGRVLSSYSKHTTIGTGYSSFGVLTKNNFDKIGRISSIEKKWGNNNFKTIAAYTYDDMGKLKMKRLDPGYTGSGKNELEALTYSYNLQGNLTGINKDYALKTPSKYNKWSNFFGFYLGYDNRDGVFSSANLNGQAAGQLWTTQGDDQQRRYDYTYDNAGRLVKAIFTERQTANDAWNSQKLDFSVTGTDNGKIRYDLNGNLLSMIQKGFTLSNATPVELDNLQYTYAQFSNKLLKVADLSTTIGQNNGKAGDFKDGSNGSDNDYDYDANGNLIMDLNKDAYTLPQSTQTGKQPGIKYNFLDKPEEVIIAGKGTIRFVYDADGNKLQKLFIPVNSTTPVVTTYINSYVYIGSELQYIGFEEGRIRVMQDVSQNNGFDYLTLSGNLTLPNGKKGVFDYYLRDYQQNVRMILTEETHVGSNICTMEMARASGEEGLFGQSGAANEVVTSRFPVADIPGQTSGAGWQNPDIGSQVSRLGNLTGKRMGPNALLKVMGGDEVSATVQYYYRDPATTSGVTESLLNDVLNSLVKAITGSTVTGGVTSEGATTVSNTLGSSYPFSNAVSPYGNETTNPLPKAYLTILFFDERFQFVSEGSTFVRVQQAGSGAPALVLPNIRAPKNGYCYVYLSNASNEPVYFDGFRVTHNRGRIIEENHYYAYGLKIAGLSSRKIGDLAEGKLDNQYLYQGTFSELDEDLGWQDFTLRNYDPQIGRWVQQDPFHQFASPYLGMGADPINGIDPSGGIIFPPGGVLIKTGAEVVSKVMPGITITTKIVSKTNSLGSKVGSLVKALLPVSRVAVNVAESVCVGCAELNKVKAHNWREPTVKFPQTFMQSADMSPLAQQRIQDWTEFHERNSAFQKATIDPLAVQASLPILNFTKEAVQSPLRNSVGLIESIKDGNGWKAAGFGVLLMMDVSALRGGGEVVEGGAAALAKAWQGKGAYPGVDAWRNITLKEGTIIVGGLPGQSEYYTTLSGLNRSGFSQSNLWEGLQVQPHPLWGPRKSVGIYRVKKTTQAAFGTTYANPQFGAGGLPQIFVPKYQNNLELISTMQLK
ncbi:DUF6443 domain-containing protein [Flavisolibacter nicotianae]|uniref:DUF6443 domain-containing protein n=1 Tax=Flavisolibacter nicotianae TaxID=2364882 RepID=UPI000EAD48BD|nr:DUF6443 domain-containing protein [Flavisolibacter nicotianae]